MSDSSGPTPFRFRDPRERLIYERLGRLVGAAAASFFRDACKLMSSEAWLDATTHFVGHALREIESMVRDVLEALSEETTRSSGNSSERPQQDSHRQEIKAFLRELGIPETDPAAKYWLSVADKYGENALHRRAHHRGLAAVSPVDPGFREFWNRMQIILDRVLDRLEANFSRATKAVEVLAAKVSPTRADVQTLRDHIPNTPDVLAQFFDRIEDPAWLSLLDDAGYFCSPYEPVRDQEAGTIAFPLWPPSRYLARMAKVDSHEIQVQVLAIALSIPETENARVHDDLADAALALPPSLAERLASHAQSWLTRPQLLLPRKLGKLISHLAGGGRTNAAIALARTLLAVIPSPKTNAEVHLDFPPRPQSSLREWDYEEILKQNVPYLISATKEKGLEVLCDLLDDAVRLSLKKPDPTTREDYSYVGRPAVENDPEHSNEVNELLISAVRDAGFQIVGGDPGRLDSVLAILDRRPWYVFERIALHLLRVTPGTPIDVIAARLLNRKLFDAYQVRHEYYHLMHGAYVHLSPEQQKTIVEWSTSDQDPGELLRKLAPIHDHLPKEWREKYDDLVEKHGRPVGADFVVSEVAVAFGPTSPKSVGELQQMNTAQTAKYLREWEPPGGFAEPSAEGLARLLTDAVKATPERYAEEAQLFEGVDPTYLSGLLRGFEEAVKAKHVFPWKRVVELCGWVVSQPRDAAERKDKVHLEINPGWGWTRKVVASLIGAGVQAQDGGIPFTLASRVWEVLAILVEDLDPTPQNEQRFGGDNMDPVTLAINTVRGEALGAVIDHAMWIRRNRAKERGGDERQGFEEMPEVREVLDRHLDLNVDPSLAIRAIYGLRFPTLVVLDHTWAESAAPKVFPPDETLRPYWDAAWEGYLAFNLPYNNVFSVLRSEYTRAIERIGKRSEVRRPANPDERLAEHLMVFLLRDVLSLDDDLVERFFSRAPGELRKRALEFIGQDLREGEGPVPEVLLQRGRELWERRLKVAKDSRRLDQFAEELAAIGMWFFSGVFDEAWMIEQIMAVLELGIQPGPEHFVMERLAQIAPANPLDAIRIAQKMVETDKSEWGLAFWRDDLKTIITTTMASGDTEAGLKARELANRLVARGLGDFKDLAQ